MFYCVLLSFVGYTAHTSLQNARVLLFSIILIFSLINNIFSKIFKPTFQRALLNAPEGFKCLYLAWALWRPSGLNRAPHLIKDFFFQNPYLFLVELFPVYSVGCQHFHAVCNVLLAMFTQRLQMQLLLFDPCSELSNDSIVLWLLTILLNLTPWYLPENGLDKTAKALSCMETEPLALSITLCTVTQYKFLHTTVLHSPGHSCQTPCGNTSPRSPSLRASLCSSFWNNHTTVHHAPVLTTTQPLPCAHTLPDHSLSFPVRISTMSFSLPSIKGNSIKVASLLKSLRTFTKGIFLCVRRANENKRQRHYTREVINPCLLN